MMPMVPPSPPLSPCFVGKNNCDGEASSCEENVDMTPKTPPRILRNGEPPSSATSFRSTPRVRELLKQQANAFRRRLAMSVSPADRAKTVQRRKRSKLVQMKRTRARNVIVAGLHNSAGIRSTVLSPSVRLRLERERDQPAKIRTVHLAAMSVRRLEFDENEDIAACAPILDLTTASTATISSTAGMASSSLSASPSTDGQFAAAPPLPRLTPGAMCNVDGNDEELVVLL